MSQTAAITIPTRANRRSRLRPWSIASVLVGLASWWVVTQWGLVSPQMLPSPSAIWTAFERTSTQGYAGESLWGNSWISLMRLFWGFLLAIVIGVPLGLAMGRSRIINAMAYPTVELYRPLPTLAYYTLIILWFGLGDASKIILLALGTLPPILLAGSDAARSVLPERIDGARSLGVGRIRMFMVVVLPSCMPEILSGIRTGFGFGFTSLVAAEMVASSSGIGYMVQQANQYSQVDVVITALIVLGIFALLVDLGLQAIRRLVLPWHGKA